MADNNISASPRLTYRQPSYKGQNRSSRSSSRNSRAGSFVASASSLIDSPRTLCPRDGDAFSYNASHLAVWYMPQGLWDRLTPQLQSALAAMQHAGAAVLTGYERLGEHTKSLDGAHPEPKMDDDTYFVELDNGVPITPLKLRTTSNASSMLSTLASPVFSASSASTSGSTTPPLDMSASQTLSPVSPICLTPSDAKFPYKRDRSRERSFSTPLESHKAYYAMELSHLRTESIPRLRHTTRKVDTEWYEAKRANAVSILDVVEFEEWWVKQKSAIRDLDEEALRLSVAGGIAPTGMGWTA